MHQLYEFQQRNKEQIRQAFKHHKHVLYQAGTGAGKTVVASSIIKAAAEKGMATWFLAHRRELIEQSHRTLYDWGVRSGIIMAGHRYHPNQSVQCASIDTVRERLLKGDKKKLLVLHPPQLIVIDEAHRSLSKTYLDLISYFPDAWLLGLTATPIRSDGRGLGHVYEHMVQAPSVAELIELGFLVKPRYFEGASPDLEGLPTHDYDYAQAALEARFDNVDLRGDVVEQWIRHGENRKTIVFASGVKHSLALRNDFENAGIKAMHIDGTTLTSERADLIYKFRTSNEYRVLCNCMIVTEGFDVPEVGCVQLATSTKIISKYLQMGGRALRADRVHSKKDCIIIDHGGNRERHGFLEDPIPWTLDTEGRIIERIAEAREKVVQEFVCSQCGCVFSGRVRCPECGTRLEIQGQHELINSVEELIEVTRGALGVKAADKQKTYTDTQKRNFLSEVVAYASGDNRSRKTYKDNWVKHTYRAKFGEFPPWSLRSVEPVTPSKAVIAFINAKFSAYQIRKKFGHG